MEYFPRQERVNQELNINAAKIDMNFQHFVSLNISTSGLLIASDYYVDFSKKNFLYVVIDPCEQILERSIACTATVVRLAKGDSKGLEKYKLLEACPKGTSSIFGIYIEYMSSSDYTIWSNFVNQFVQKKRAG